MKYLAGFLLAPLLGLVGFLVWAAMTYTIVETSNGGEWMVLKAEQAAECKAGCGVFSGRELAKLFARLMMEQRKAPTL